MIEHTHATEEVCKLRRNAQLLHNNFLIDHDSDHEHSFSSASGIQSVPVLESSRLPWYDSQLSYVFQTGLVWSPRADDLAELHTTWTSKVYLSGVGGLFISRSLVAHARIFHPPSI